MIYHFYIQSAMQHSILLYDYVIIHSNILELYLVDIHAYYHDMILVLKWLNGERESFTFGDAGGELGGGGGGGGGIYVVSTDSDVPLIWVCFFSDLVRISAWPYGSLIIVTCMGTR